MRIILFASVFSVLFSSVYTNLEVVHDEELMNLIRSENYVVVLFCKLITIQA